MPTDDIESIAVIGAGTMGHGIALAFALSGREVTLYDVDEDALDRASEAIASGLDTLVSADRVTDAEATVAPERITPCVTYETALDGVDLVIESTPEQMDVKRDVFRDLDEYAPSSAILASNTSGLPISEMAAEVDDPTRVLGAHWVNPPYVMPLVELVRGEETADSTADRMYELLEDMGKTPVTVEKDIPGFILNRLQCAMDYEAWSLLDRGIATPEDIDRVVAAGFGLRTPALGAFRKSDFTGLDVVRDVSSTLTPHLDRGTGPIDAVTELTDEGRLGLKTGAGVYDWSDRDPDEVAEERDRELLALVDLYEEFREARSD